MQFDFFNSAPKDTSKEQIHPVVEHAYSLAAKVLKEGAIDINEFADLYDPKNIERDLEIVRRKEVGFAHESHKVYSEVLEAVLYKQIDDGPWFGNNTRAVKTSSFDDYKNGSDIILELVETTKTLSHLSLSVDVTFGITTEMDKFLRIKEHIDKGTLGKISYFKSERANFRGELSQIPEVVIGVEKDLVIKLADLWAGEGPHKDTNKKTLDAHPVQRLIMAEILLQLHTFRTYAKNTGKQTLVPIYEKDIQILEEILREQGPMDIGELRDDKVFVAIRETLAIFKPKK